MTLSKPFFIISGIEIQLEEALKVDIGSSEKYNCDTTNTIPARDLIQTFWEKS